ncbi:TPA: hypothetical protein G9C53_004881 [Salmonella enterica subsp. enterica serovar Typhimurium var. 5-]|uniref:Uncharacterized protein n=1 Tax=Salmonella enterica subsp. enterica serovar Typhimurium var. 5- TaxID=1620419 RepID=A0A740TUF7_SALTM|nr:hypothetical protein [Salmonella enterica subsp. enterica serovar Typhimurium var. 5-]
MQRNNLYTIYMPTIEEVPEQYNYVTWAVIYGLATRKHIHPQIKKMYDAKRTEYYQSFKRSEFSIMDLTRFTTKTSDLLMNVAGIMAWSEEQNDYSYVYSLIEKGYKFTWNFLKRHGRINFPDFYKELKAGIRSDESNYQAVMGLFISAKKGYEMGVDIYETKEELKEEIEGSSIAMANLFIFSKKMYDKMVIMPKEMGEIPDERNKFYFKELAESLGIKPRNNDSLLQVINNIRSSEIDETSLDGLRGLEYFKNLDKVMSDAYFAGKVRLYTILMAWLESEGISWYDLFENYYLTESSIEKISYFLQNGLESQIIMEEEQELLLCYFLVFSAFKDEYQKTKIAYQTNRMEEVEYRALEREKKLKEEWLKKESHWKKRERILEEKAKNDKFEIHNWKIESKKLREKIATLEAEIDRLKQSEKEMAAIKSFVDLQDSDVEEKVSYNDIESYLQGKSIIIIGGSPTWQNKIRSRFPNFIFWGADDVNKDLSPLDSTEGVFIYWTYLSHPMYWKVKKRMNDNKTKLFFIERNTNLELTIEQIYYYLKNE